MNPIKSVAFQLKVPNLEVFCWKVSSRQRINQAVWSMQP